VRFKIVGWGYVIRHDRHNPGMAYLDPFDCDDYGGYHIDPCDPRQINEALLEWRMDERGTKVITLAERLRGRRR
jgi:hypothetical protein